ncbi:MAG: glycosyltransferase [Psychroflexus sp.]
MKDFKKIPIIINNFNRLSTLKKLITSLESRGYFNLKIIDNNSTYPELLDFYNQTEYKVYRLKKNIGFKALWKTPVFLAHMFDYFCYTDSDLEIIDECPDDFMEVFYKYLKSNPEIHKIGFSLKIDDLPDHYERKNEVIEWESKFYNHEKDHNMFIAPIDTTFALYRPFSKRGKRDGSVEMIRTGYPYQMRHLPWYVNSKKLSEEEKYYIESVKKPTHWTSSKKE